MTTQNNDEYFMRLALAEAEKAARAGEVPAGCVITRGGQITAKAHNQTQLLKDPTAHAEMIAITQAAAAVGDFRLTECALYVTKEPCAMCSGAIVLARIPAVIWGVDDPKRGGNSVFGILQSPALIHRPKITTGILAAESLFILQEFFRAKRHEHE